MDSIVMVRTRQAARRHTSAAFEILMDFPYDLWTRITRLIAEEWADMCAFRATCKWQGVRVTLPLNWGVQVTQEQLMLLMVNEVQPKHVKLEPNAYHLQGGPLFSPLMHTNGKAVHCLFSEKDVPTEESPPHVQSGFRGVQPAPPPPAPAHAPSPFMVTAIEQQLPSQCTRLRGNYRCSPSGTVHCPVHIV